MDEIGDKLRAITAVTPPQNCPRGHPYWRHLCHFISLAASTRTLGFAALQDYTAHVLDPTCHTPAYLSSLPLALPSVLLKAASAVAAPRTLRCLAVDALASLSKSLFAAVASGLLPAESGSVSGHPPSLCLATFTTCPCVAPPVCCLMTSCLSFC